MKIVSLIKFTFILIVISSSVNQSIVLAQLANGYPHDISIQNDPGVIFTEMFEQDSVPLLLTSYTNFTNSGNIFFDSSVPPGSLGMQSCKLTSYHTPQSLNGTEMRHKFSSGISDSVFVRFYVKYNNSHTHHHSGIWLHGSNPANGCFPCIYPGRVGLPPGGDSAFSLGAELRGSTQTAQTMSTFGMFNYWTEMHPNSSNQYWGNEFINANPNSIINTTEWNCVEVMLKLNAAVTDSSGEAKLWINGQVIEYYGKDFPTGTWSQLMFTQGIGQPFEGFKWRSSSLVLFNSIWIKNYSPLSTDPLANDILYDHIVVAKNYIGPIYIPPAETENVFSTQVSIHPNPANGIINFSKTVKQVSVWSIYGQLLFQNENTESISTAGIQNGIYILQTENTFHKIVVRQ